MALLLTPAHLAPEERSMLQEVHSWMAQGPPSANARAFAELPGVWCPLCWGQGKGGHRGILLLAQ